ncbi:F0F1 ATP synthase subunit B [Gordonia sp. PP30]|uniref:F0F1 ATP synthase subunit B n=1 Tax=unclassified Gordonia (in: high G+C Gram-positive bacteria) TaxID=2657482 RepID=UPI001FFE7B4A|nr:MULTISPECIES: F0F1 ATP synthase subunit B [unclassified Gordonia (in: high G+C Gram-positive bacteria)]UQE76340.1 F0F1 ATP synthase subunit B [Gordonia sp. PP30]
MINTTGVLYLAATAGEGTEEQPNPLLPHWYDIIWSLVAFAVVLFVFWKFVVPMYQKVLDERRETIEGGIERAEAAQAEANASLVAYREQLAGAREEASAIRDEARQQGTQIISDMKAQATAESDRIIANGAAQLQAQRQQVVAELRNDVGRLSVDLAEKLVATDLSDATKQAGTVDRFLAELDDVADPAAK